MEATNKTYITFPISKNKNFEFEIAIGYNKWNKLFSFSVDWESKYFDHWKTPVIDLQLLRLVYICIQIFDTRDSQEGYDKEER